MGVEEWVMNKLFVIFSFFGGGTYASFFCWKKKKDLAGVIIIPIHLNGTYASLYSCIPSYEPKLTVSFWNSHHYGFWLLSLPLYKSFCRIHPSLLKQGMAKFNWSIFKFLFFLIPYWLIAIPQNINFFLINSGPRFPFSLLGVDTILGDDKNVLSHSAKFFSLPKQRSTPMIQSYLTLVSEFSPFLSVNKFVFFFFLIE